MPVFDVLWSMLWFFLFVAWLWVVIGVLADMFRNPGISAVGKAGWMVLIILVPWLGVLIYLIFNGDGMAMRLANDIAANERATQKYVRQAAGTSYSPADELSKLAGLRDSGVVSDPEYAAMKARVLA
jgi:hypothetical protein